MKSSSRDGEIEVGSGVNGYAKREGGKYASCYWRHRRLSNTAVDPILAKQLRISGIHPVDLPVT